MIPIADHPTPSELDQFATALNSEPLDRGALIVALRRIEQGLRDHGRELDRLGGLLDEKQKAARMSLAREDQRLREEIKALVSDAERLEEAAVSGGRVEELRRRGSALLAGLRGHRDAEASLVLESVETEVGAGD
jgi:hypothetical protein